ncbi:hypothetical protein FN846DRAFT_941810 [Sphaerosporella brunnea]|uniref:Uncharacterized protein n=1 Tax=Sphaerosporella brunnea TaxID=1250544 RepID=A0A5J5F1P9_9PEZI|nr:hypothetical protein FN846DRAFT_941810 [Sphaerosporella brunnea]
MAGKSSALAPVQAIATTVSVMDQHGKVVHNGSKTFFSALREAKEAYKQRKAEIAAERQAQRRAREKVMASPGRPQRRQTDPVLTIQNSSSSNHKDERKKPHRRQTTRAGPVTEDSIAEDSLVVREDALVRRDSSARRRRSHDEDELQVSTRGAGAMAAARNPALEMAPALFNDPSVIAVQTLLARVQSIIDELQCWTVGLTTLITELQKTPETFAAVGLSLAEIAQMATHVAPAAMVVLKTAFPTVFALINSPHFAVIAGVAGAATVIVLGGYKIVKSIMAGADDNLKMAYGELPDEALMEEANLGGEILGEVIEEQNRLLEQQRYTERVEELPPVGIPRSASKRERKALPPTEDPIAAQFRPENRVLSGLKEKKPEKAEKVEKKERKHEKKESGREKEKEKRNDREERKDKDKDSRRVERRATTRQNSSSSSGVSSNRSESSLDRHVKEDKKEKEKEKSKSSSNKDKDGGEKEKDKKKVFSMKATKALFSGKSV